MQNNDKPLCGYPVRDENSIVYKINPCGDPSVDYLEFDVEGEPKKFRVHVCEHHYYFALKLTNWQAAQMLRENKFKGEWI